MPVIEYKNKVSKKVFNYGNMPKRLSIEKRAKWMRQHPTKAENQILIVLKLLKKEHNIFFITQKIIEPCILDFYFPKYKVCIEIDGKTHEKTPINDEIRDEFIKMMI